MLRATVYPLSAKTPYHGRSILPGCGTERRFANNWVGVFQINRFFIGAVQIPLFRTSVDGLSANQVFDVGDFCVISARNSVLAVINGVVDLAY